MRPRVTTGPDIAILASQLRELKDKFDYPDLFGRGGSASLPAVGGGGGAPTVVVAASDSSDFSKGRADFICVGVDDQETVRAAYELLPSVAGRILLTEGTFWFDAGLTLQGSTVLQGMGNSTRILLSAPIQTSGAGGGAGAGPTIRDMVLGGGGSGTCLRLWGDDQRVINVHFFSADVAIEGAQDSYIIGCSSQLVATFYDSSDIWSGTTIANSRINTVGAGIGDIILGEACRDHLIVGNFISGRIITDTSVHRSGIHIVGNIWPDNNDGSPVFIDLDGCPGLVVVGNQIPNAQGFDGMRLEDCPGALIEANRIDNCDLGISVIDTDDALIQGNVLGGTAGIGSLTEHGIVLTDVRDCVVADNTIILPGQSTDNTFDGILVDGNSDRNYIHGNRITAPAAGNQPRYGINVSAATCNDNIYAGNWAGPTANFGTAPYNDAGTGTLNVWPGAAAPVGDNFTL